jgi:hypothetical protein
MFFFVDPCRPYIPCNSQDGFHQRGHIGHHSNFVFSGVGLSSGHLPFHERQFLMAIIFGVPMSLTVFTLSNVPFVFGRFEFYFALFFILYIEYVLVIWDRLKFYKNLESGSLVLYCLIFQIFVIVCPSFSISVFISSGLME